MFCSCAFYGYPFVKVVGLLALGVKIEFIKIESNPGLSFLARKDIDSDFNSLAIYVSIHLSSLGKR